jgi:HSP20 family protein
MGAAEFVFISKRLGGKPQETKMRLPSLWSNRDMVDPFRALQREMDNLFGDYAKNWPMAQALRAPAINVAESDGEFEVTAELPGVDQKDIKLSLEGNRLILSGEKREERQSDDKNFHVMERSYGSFHRTIALPFEPSGDTVDAQFENGILHLRIKKPVSAQQQQKIEIRSSGQQQQPPQEQTPQDNKAA